MNLLRGDIARLQRCTHPLSGARDELPRVKPLYYSYEKEIVLYARFRNLQYFATECIYAPNSYRGHARTFIKQLERLRPRSITDILASGQFLSKICKSLHQNSSQNDKNRAKIMQISGGRLSIQTRSTCQKCGSISSQPICYACSLLDILRRLNSPGLKNDVQYISVDRRTIESNAKTKEIACIEDLVTENSTKKKTCACGES
uniref:Cytoplasmic tRNA 2-thiolation protein 1 C-terminal domain-containing protein n=1 Tax=Romanomermis culicivorax TaxID=13658 RepID=A0A915I0G0_ROMCU